MMGLGRSVTIGIIGGGQLARMLILAGKPMGFEFKVFAQKPQPSVEGLVDIIDSDFDHEAPIAGFLEQVDVVTYEHENVPVHFLSKIEGKKALHPPREAIRQAQDRLFEKRLFVELDIPTNTFCSVNDEPALRKAAEALGYPFILKSRRQGYDGRHQTLIREHSDLDKIVSQDGSDFLAEAFVDFDYEVSIIGVRGRGGEIAFYDLCYNKHQNGILYRTENKGPDPELASTAQSYLTRIMEHVNYVGVLTLELFVKDGCLLANEMAPRVHNSGHWTIEGAVTSQFENHIRAITGLPLGLTRSLGYSALFNGITELPPVDEVLEIPGTYYHDYQKPPRQGRKLGHVSLLSRDREDFNEASTRLQHIFDKASLCQLG